jgi:hypothetical protein
MTTLRHAIPHCSQPPVVVHNFMEENDAINSILNLDYSSQGKISTLSVAIRGARELCERDIINGTRNASTSLDLLEKQISNKTFISNKFLGIASYLIIIDLIGTIFKKKNFKESKDRFVQALNHFSNLNKQDIISLKNLRNSLAHKFSLGNESEVFVLDYSENSDKIIKPASMIYPSHMRRNPKDETNMTIVYYVKLCDFVEDIYLHLKELNESNQLEITSKYKANKKIKEFDFNPMYFVE